MWPGLSIEAAHSCPNNLRSLAPAYKLVIEAGIIYQINSSVMETHPGQSRRQEVPWPSTATTTTRELYIPSARLITPWIMLIGLSVIGFLQQHGETIELQIIRHRILHLRPVQTNSWLNVETGSKSLQILPSNKADNHTFVLEFLVCKTVCCKLADLPHTKLTK